MGNQGSTITNITGQGNNNSGHINAIISHDVFKNDNWKFNTTISSTKYYSHNERGINMQFSVNAKYNFIK